MTNPEPRWANLAETAAYMRLHRRTVQRLATAGTITAHRLDGTTRYNLNEVDAALTAGNLDDIRAVVAASGPTPTPANVIARIRAALPPDVAGAKPLIQIARVHAAIDKVAAELGVES